MGLHGGDEKASLSTPRYDDAQDEHLAGALQSMLLQEPQAAAVPDTRQLNISDESVKTISRQSAYDSAFPAQIIGELLRAPLAPTRAKHLAKNQPEMERSKALRQLSHTGNSFEKMYERGHLASYKRTDWSAAVGSRFRFPIEASPPGKENKDNKEKEKGTGHAVPFPIFPCFSTDAALAMERGEAGRGGRGKEDAENSGGCFSSCKLRADPEAEAEGGEGEGGERAKEGGGARREGTEEGGGERGEGGGGEGGGGGGPAGLKGPFSAWQARDPEREYRTAMGAGMYREKDRDDQERKQADVDHDEEDDEPGFAESPDGSPHSLQSNRKHETHAESRRGRHSNRRGCTMQ
jgi:hypothetical protein